MTTKKSLNSSEAKNTVKRLSCRCVNAFADKLYGLGVRVHNLFHKPTPGGYRCTTCGHEKT